MPNEKDIDPRALASWRVRACAAGLCVGTQIFLAGCAIGMPIALSSAWLSALPAVAFALWLTARSCRACRKNMCYSKIQCVILALTLLFSCVFSCASMAGYAAQTLTTQMRTAWIQALSLSAAALCALSGGTGTSRLCFALRYVLPALTLILSLAAVPMRVPVGLFPILGAGAPDLGAASACMLFSASPALMLMLPAPDLTSNQQRSAVPEASFFLRRMLPCALAGMVLLFFSSACTTYESIAQSTAWGSRLRLAAGAQAHEGVQQMILTLAKLMAMLLLSANMLSAAQQALLAAFPSLGHASLGLLTLLAALALAASVILGDHLLLMAAPLTALPAALLTLFPGRGHDA